MLCLLFSSSFSANFCVASSSSECSSDCTFVKVSDSLAAALPSSGSATVYICTNETVTLDTSHVSTPSLTIQGNYSNAMLMLALPDKQITMQSLILNDISLEYEFQREYQLMNLKVSSFLYKNVTFPAGFANFSYSSLKLDPATLQKFSVSGKAVFNASALTVDTNMSTLTENVSISLIPPSASFFTLSGIKDYARISQTASSTVIFVESNQTYVSISSTVPLSTSVLSDINDPGQETFELEQESIPDSYWKTNALSVLLYGNSSLKLLNNFTHISSLAGDSVFIEANASSGKNVVYIESITGKDSTSEAYITCDSPLIEFHTDDIDSSVRYHVYGQSPLYAHRLVELFGAVRSLPSLNFDDSFRGVGAAIRKNGDPISLNISTKVIAEKKVPLMPLFLSDGTAGFDPSKRSELETMIGTTYDLICSPSLNCDDFVVEAVDTELFTQTYNQPSGFTKATMAFDKICRTYNETQCVGLNFSRNPIPLPTSIPTMSSFPTKSAEATPTKTAADAEKENNVNKYNTTVVVTVSVVIIVAVMVVLYILFTKKRKAINEALDPAMDDGLVDEQVLVA